jgi:peptidoglycan/LPS O-acetylase OafA/YrhL
VRPYVLADCLVSLRSLIAFTAGALVTKHRRESIGACRRPGSWATAVVGIRGLLFYSYNKIIERQLCNFINIQALFVRPVLVSAGSSLLIVPALASSDVASVINRPLPQFLGRISYSLYMYCMLIILGIIHFWKYSLPSGWFC